MSSKGKNLVTDDDQTNKPLVLDKLTIRIVQSLQGIKAEDWDHCLSPSGSPFLRYSFLLGLELTACVGGQSGWYPRYILVEHEGRLLGVSPAYIKTHSQGEFIFDWSWADAAHRMMSYYPKLVVARRFLPVGSEKFLCDPLLNVSDKDVVRQTLLRVLSSFVLKKI